MKLCLIYPPTDHMIRTNVPSVVDSVTGCYPPLGLLYVAGAVESAGHHAVTAIDCVAEQLAPDDVAARVAAEAPDVVGIQVLTFSVVDAVLTVSAIRVRCPAVRIVMGGPHANLYPAETLQLDGVDYVLLGEGEQNINPFLDCIFCDRPHLGKRFRARSAAHIVAEMRECRERFGIDEFFFYDDTFTIDRQRVFDICEAIRAAGMRSFWDIRARISTVDRDMLEALHGAGCHRIHFGIESGNADVLRVMRKGVNLDRARDVFRWCREIGIETLAYFMYGFPGEGPAEIADTARYALSIECDYVHVAVTTPFPGTELYRMGLERGLYDHDYWAEFARRPRQDFVPRLWDENLSRDALIEAMLNLYRRFYRRPSYILRRLARLRSPRELWIKARAGLQLLFGKEGDGRRETVPVCKLLLQRS